MGVLLSLIISVLAAAFVVLAALFIFRGIPFLVEKSNERAKKIIKMNRLFQCKNEKCKKLFRQYQKVLYNEKHSEFKCPHCEMKLKAVNPYKSHHYSDNYYMIEQVDPWMNTHPDCPVLDKKRYKNIVKTINVLKKLKKEEAQQQRYEEYNNFKVDFSWVENLNKEAK